MCKHVIVVLSIWQLNGQGHLPRLPQVTGTDGMKPEGLQGVNAEHACALALLMKRHNIFRACLTDTALYTLMEQNLALPVT